MGEIKECAACGGSKYIIENNKKIPCLCLLRDRAKKYLGPIYADLKYSSAIKFEKWVDNSIYFELCSIDDFKSMVKSFLLYNNMKLSHHTIFPYDIVQGFFENRKSEELDFINNVDFLAILFRNDPPNKLYGELLKTLFDRRILYNKITWLFLAGSHESEWFIDKYSAILGKYIKDNFKRSNINKIKFRKGGHK